MTNKITTTEIDFIGDIHPTRKVFFVGDFIDRGPDIRGVLEIVRPMIENGTAYTVLGNHEYNAICYWTMDEKGNPLREHSERNMNQHGKTIDSFTKTDLLMEYVEWFKTLPIYFENEHFRVIHAQWKQEYIDQLKKNDINNFGNLDFLICSAKRHTNEYKMIDCLLKGEEMDVPGVYFEDKDHNKRFSYRLKWWMNGDNLLCGESLFEFPESESKAMTVSIRGYNQNEVPVLFGHYWLKNSQPRLQGPNVCCLDFSVAKEGILVAYRWNGERELRNDRFEYVRSRDHV